MDEIYAVIGSDGSIVLDTTTKELLSYRAGEEVIIRFTSESEDWNRIQAIRKAQSLEIEPVTLFLSSCNSASISEELTTRLRSLT